MQMKHDSFQSREAETDFFEEGRVVRDKDEARMPRPAETETVPEIQFLWLQ